MLADAMLDGILCGFGATKQCLQILTRALAFRCDALQQQSDNSDTQVRRTSGTRQAESLRSSRSSEFCTSCGIMQAVGGPQEPSIVPRPYALIRHGDTYRFASDQQLAVPYEEQALHHRALSRRTALSAMCITDRPDPLRSKHSLYGFVCKLICWSAAFANHLLLQFCVQTVLPSLNVLQESPEFQHTLDKCYKRLHVKLDDADHANLLLYLPSATAFIESALYGRGKVLVHCAAGISRSATASNSRSI